MKFFLFLWWRINPTVNIRVWIRAINGPTGVKAFDDLMLKTCFNQCTPLEREFLERHGYVFVARPM